LAHSETEPALPDLQPPEPELITPKTYQCLQSPTRHETSYAMSCHHIQHPLRKPGPSSSNWQENSRGEQPS
jgi:hypothetical protein